MGQRTLDGGDISELRAAYDRKIHQELPARARAADDWPIHADHCFARVVLDALFEDAWYEHVDGRPAYEHLSPDELEAAIGIADRMLTEGRSAVVELHAASLRWRNESRPDGGRG